MQMRNCRKSRLSIKTCKTIWRRSLWRKNRLCWQGMNETHLEVVVDGLQQRTVTMIHLFWNCRSLGSNKVVLALHGLIRKHRPSMIFLSKNKMKYHRIEGVRRPIGYSDRYNVALVRKAGGLSLWWDDSLKVEVIESSKHFIDARCSYIDS